jgi:diacylglycerol diphosphate phosphatase/phosphatidate phosphatase
MDAWNSSSGCKPFGWQISHPLAVGLSESVTCTLKYYVSRRRPNFYSLCEFDVNKLQCMSPLEKIREASLSFPSGHSSFSFCGMTFLMLFLLGRVALITSSSSITLPPSGGSRVIKLAQYKSILGVLCCLVPWSWSFFIASSRIVDKWHHPSDVVAGSLLGIAAATISYHAFYPCLVTPKAGVPLSLLQQQQPNNSTV